MNKDDVKVFLQDGKRKMQDERKIEQEKNDRNHRRVERSHGKFTLGFLMPAGADESAVMAEFKDGMLVVKLNKAAKAKSHAVDVAAT